MSEKYYLYSANSEARNGRKEFEPISQYVLNFLNESNFHFSRAWNTVVKNLGKVMPMFLVSYFIALY